MIEKNIPIPDISRKWASIASDMSVGDSYMDENGTDSNASGSKALNSFLQYGRRNGMKFIARKVEGGIRIWRVA